MSLLLYSLNIKLNLNRNIFKHKHYFRVSIRCYRNDNLPRLGICGCYDAKMTMSFHDLYQKSNVLGLNPQVDYTIRHDNSKTPFDLLYLSLNSNSNQVKKP